MPTRTRPVHGTQIARSLRVVRPNDRIRDFAGRLQLHTVAIDGVLQGGAALGTAYLGGLALLEQNRRIETTMSETGWSATPTTGGSELSRRSSTGAAR